MTASLHFEPVTSNPPDPTPAAPILPPATIGILGGGQLGRMFGLAARAMGYRIVVLDPDPDCPAAAIADAVIPATYDDIGAALRLAERSDVVTYELEHIAAAIVPAIEPLVPVRPGRQPLLVTQDRLAERRFVEGAGIAVAPWREVRTTDELRAAAAPDVLGLPLRVKVAIGGYDGRGQVRVTDAGRYRGRADPTRGHPVAARPRRAGPDVRRRALGRHRREVSMAPSRASRSPGTCTPAGSSSNPSRRRRSERRSRSRRRTSADASPSRWTWSAP